MTVETEANKALARRFFEEVLSGKRPELADELVAPDHQPRGAVVPLPPGPEGIKRLAAAWGRAFPDAEGTIEDLIAEGDRVVYRWTTRATHRGEFLGAAPTGRRITATGIVILRLAGGKIAEVWQCHDLLGLKQQLGLLPDAPPATR